MCDADMLIRAILQESDYNTPDARCQASESDKQ